LAVSIQRGVHNERSNGYTSEKYRCSPYGGPVILSNGVPVTGISGAAGSEQFYAIEVPAGQDELKIRISGGTGDCDLYVRKDAAPTTTTYDYRPYKVGNDETVIVENPEAGTWHIMLQAYSTFSGLTLVATYSAATSEIPLENGVPVTDLAGAAASETFFTIEVPAGQDNLEISISGGTGDCDLYVRKDMPPTTIEYDYRPYKVGNNETVSVETPEAGTWYIMLRGYSSYSGLTSPRNGPRGGDRQRTPLQNRSPRRAAQAGDQHLGRDRRL